MRRRRRRYGREHGRSQENIQNPAPQAPHKENERTTQHGRKNQTTWLHGPRVTMWRTRPHGFMESHVGNQTTWLHQKAMWRVSPHGFPRIKRQAKLSYKHHSEVENTANDVVKHSLESAVLGHCIAFPRRFERAQCPYS
eukprot:gene18473-biopygen21958